MNGARPFGRLSRKQRVRKRAEFRDIQTRARRVKTRHFILLLKTRVEDDQRVRLGITASRKVGNAVVRNRAKRVVREAFRSTRELWPPGYDLVVIVRHFEGNLRLADVVQEWAGVRSTVSRVCETNRTRRQHSKLAPGQAALKAESSSGPTE